MKLSGMTLLQMIVGTTFFAISCNQSVTIHRYEFCENRDLQIEAINSSIVNQDSILRIILGDKIVFRIIREESKGEESSQYIKTFVVEDSIKSFTIDSANALRHKVFGSTGGFLPPHVERITDVHINGKLSNNLNWRIEGHLGSDSINTIFTRHCE